MVGGDVDFASLAARAGGVSTSSTSPGATVDGELTAEYREVAGVELGRWIGVERVISWGVMVVLGVTDGADIVAAVTSAKSSGGILVEVL